VTDAISQRLGRLAERVAALEASGTERQKTLERIEMHLTHQDAALKKIELLIAEGQGAALAAAWVARGLMALIGTAAGALGAAAHKLFG
jgi:uncharacterized coiled-coil protein SlyX